MSDTSSFDGAFAFTTRPDIEGGLVDDPADPGGLTNHGLTIADLTLWERHKATPADVRALTLPTSRPVYFALYWTPIAGSMLPKGIALSVFDHAVNRGIGTSGRLLQTVLGLTGGAVDGIIGPETRAFLRAQLLTGTSEARLDAMLLNLHVAQAEDYAALDRANYEHGWEVRCQKRLEAAREAAGL